MNSAGVIRASGNAGVHVGNNFSIIHNHYPTDSYAETVKATVRTEFLQRLFASPYKDRKNRNPKRVDGTCEWFTAHRLFRNWRQETSALLWVSADPGCGKSVLAKYLIDEVLPSSATRITCYFFFKDDFADQKVLEGALCCILHQLFTQEPILLSDEILENFKTSGDRFFASFDNLWDTLIWAILNYDQREIVCILDALDECVDQTRLAEVLTQHYSKTQGNSRLKFLVTSRPYLRIQRDFQILKESQPTIHLSGESQEEVDKIEQEITLVIKQRVDELAQRLQLIAEEKRLLHEELAAVRHRTYLWVYLVFDVFKNAVWLAKDELRAIIRNLPRTVEEAYNDILRKSCDPDKARRILHIIVAARRPLYLKEMAIVLALQGGNQRCYRDLEQAILPLGRLRDAIREACGLFVIIQDTQIFLLHQTAREFLVRLVPASPGVCSPSLEWQHSLDLKESHRLLSDICVKYLLLTISNTPALSWRLFALDDVYDLSFENYTACHWTDHYRQAYNTRDPKLEHLALQLCDTDSFVCSYWLGVYKTRKRGIDLHRELTTSLLIASYFGLDGLVNLILQENQTSLDARGAGSQRTALSWASENGYDLIVQSLLNRVPKRRVNRDKLIAKSPVLGQKLSSKYTTIINRTDEFGKSPLWYSVVNGHRSVVQRLLDGGADVNTKDKNGLTPLSWAAILGHGEIVALLLEKGARQNFKSSHLEMRDKNGRTPLLRAAYYNDEVLAWRLLNMGAEVDALDKDGCTSLIYASQYGYNEVVKLLLSSSAKVNASNTTGFTPLIFASQRCSIEVVNLLLSSGAEVNASDVEGCTPLFYASLRGHNEIVKLLLDSGAKVDLFNIFGQTALLCASKYGHEAIVKLLLDNGANTDISDGDGWTPLIIARNHGHGNITRLLRERGAGK